MANFNKVILAGNLTRDPQLSYTAIKNMAVVEFGMAINRRWKGADGNQKDETCFVDCRCFGRAAETLNQYMSKGRPLLIDGRLDYQQWTTPEGQKRSRLMVIVERFEFLGGAPGGRGQGQGQAPQSAGVGAEGEGDAGDAPPPPGDADIPF